MSTPKDMLIRVEHLSKRFCRSLRKSLKYGLQDIAADLIGGHRGSNALRPGEFMALDDVSFELRRGECIGLIGRNGAGKTTLLKILNGLIKPDAGQVVVRGRVGALVALGAGFNPLLSGRENIYVNGSILGMRRAEIDRKLESIIDFAELRDFIDAPVQSYSSGMIVRLGFAVAVHCEPDSLLLDEVLAVGDSAFQAKCYNTLSQFRTRGIGFILVSHNLSAIDCFCDRVVYLRKGRSVFVGNTQTGIGQFNRDMLSDTQLATGSDNRFDQVCGTGRVRIRRVLFVDRFGREITETRSGQPVTVRIEYACVPGPAWPTFVDIHIKDQGGVFYHDPHAAELRQLSGRGYIDVCYHSMPANNQRLLFSIALCGIDNWELYDWKCDLPLTVEGSPGSQGRIYLTCESKVVQEDACLVETGATVT
jgi:lipopolysaccharide transport system ATP-binding protein